MAAPTIIQHQSILFRKVGEEWAFQPTATEFPTMWGVSGELPDGLELDAGSGLISGAATLPGVYNFTLYARNADGISAPESFTMGIESAPIGNRAGVSVSIDVGTGQVFFTQEQAGKAPQVRVKRGDDVIWLVQFMRSGVPIPTTVNTFEFAAKRYEPESVIVSGDTFEALTTSQVALRTTLTDAALTGALSDEEADENTVIPCICEFTWTEDQPSPAVGATEITRSSRSFVIEIERDIT